MATSGGQENYLSVEQVSIALEDTHSSEDTPLPRPLPRSSNIVTGSSERKPSEDVEYAYTLSVKYQSNTEDFLCKALSKATVPLVESTKCVDFESIADGDINFQYVVVYQLESRKEGMKSILDNLSEEIENGQVLGLIVVNTSDTLTPHRGFWDVESCDFAVYIVSQRDGLYFMNILKDQDPGEVSVLIQKHTSVDEPAVVQSTDKTSGPSSRPSKSSLNYLLQNQLKVYLGTISNQGVTCEILVHVISHFSTFESQGTGTPDKGLKILKERVSRDGFLDEFLLHLVILHRILDGRVNEVYGKTPLRTDYATEFLKRMESLFTSVPKIVVHIIKNFTTKSWENFDVPWIGDSERFTIFEVLRNACKMMAGALKNRGTQSSFGIRMFWYNLALKFLCGYEHPEGYWSKVCRQESKSKLSGEAECQIVRKAVLFGQELGIPEEFAFSGGDLAEVVIKLCNDCHFKRLSMWVSYFDKTLLNKGDNLMKFMSVGFNYVSTRVTAEQVGTLSTSKDIASSVKEGVEFLCEVVELSQVPEGPNRKEQCELLFSVFDLWWKGLLDCVLLKHPKVAIEGVQKMKDKLKDADKTSFKWLTRQHLNEMFLQKLHSEVPRMKMDQFLIYARKLGNLSPAVYEEFLSKYTVGPQENLVSNPVFHSVIAEYFNNWKRGRAHFHKLFSDLILRAGESHYPYHEFISHLLHLKSDKLLSLKCVKENETAELMEVQSEFLSNLKLLVQRKKLGLRVPDDFRVFIEAGPSTLSPIQELVLSLLTTYVRVRISGVLKELDRRDTTKPVASIECLKVIIPLLVKKYREEAAWTTPPAPPYTYYWDILKHACQLIKPTSYSDPEWCTIGSVAIPHLAQVFAVYSKSHNTKSLTVEGEALSQCSDENMKQYFQWVQSVQEFIRQWQHKIVTNDWTQTELLNYANIQVSLSKIAQALFIETTVDAEHTEELKKRMNSLCDSVESLLVKGSKETESRCSVLGILAKYNVTPKPPLQALLSRGIAQYQERLLKPPVLGAEEVNEEGFFSKSLKMKELILLNDALGDFLFPLADHMDFLVHFVMNNSHLFAEYLQDQMKEIEAKEVTPSHGPSPSISLLTSLLPQTRSTLSVQAGISVKVFCGAVERTSEFLKGILTGQATYGTLCRLGCFKDASVVGAVDVDKELRIIQDFPFKGVEAHTVAGGIKSILKLIQFSGYLESIIGVCGQYKLTGCLEDEGFHQLKMIHKAISSEETKTQLTGVKSEEYLTQIREVLDLEDQDEHCLALFGMFRDSTDFYKFLKEKNYKGPDGAVYFRQQHTLITQQLQHEEYNEQVLNHLLVAFRYISPFLDCEQNLAQLMSQIYQNTRDQATKFHSNAFCQLQTVNRNIHLVRLWFTRAESDSLESIADDLSSLLKTGEFEFTISETTFVDGPDVCGSPVWWTGGQQRELRLHYTPSSTAATPDTTERVTWDLEKIEDFTRRLGFLEKGQENQDHKDFQQLSSIVQRMFTVQCKLKDLGYPHEMTTKLSCSKLQEAQDLLGQLECRLKEWRGEVKSLQTKYDKLLFFSIPKVLKIAALLRARSFDRVLREVLFLFNTGASKSETILQGIEDAAAVYEQEKETPIAFVGSVLQALYRSEKVAILSFPTRSLRSVPDVRRSATWKSTCVMHLAEGFPSKDIIRLIFEIYNHSIPGPYEVYRCRPDSTEEELALFFRRIVKFMYLEYTILNVELLSPKLQEVLLKLHLSLERSSHAVFKVHYLTTRSTVLQGMPYLTPKEHKPNTLKHDWKETCLNCRKILNDGDRAQTYLDFELVYGGAGNGKTHYIKEKIGRFKQQKLTIAVNESFNVHTAIRQMRSLKMEAKSVVYFSFTLIAPSPESTRDDVELYNSVMTKVWWFLFDLFFLGYVEDPDTGISFTMPQGLQWSFYFEVPIREGQNPDSSLELFCKEFPALELIGRPRCVREDNPYKVDNDVQLVCKYLRAYEMEGDTTHGINKLHRRGQHGGLARQLSAIKFSVLPDLCDKECHRLLNKYMPVSVKRSKMQQKLFIGYMKRRCQFLEEFPAFNYNQGGGDYKKKDGSIEHVDTTKMGSTLMGTMLLEVTSFCDPQRRDNWARTNTSRQQLVYSSGAFNLITDNPNKLSSTDQQKYKVMGVDIPDSNELSMRGYLDRVLGMALSLKNSSFELKPLLVALGETKIVEVIKPIEKQQYVLTLDYTLKMLEIHERFECGVPVIIEGETGVGKTALVEMLSILWNDSLLGSYDVLVNNIYTLLNRVSEGEAVAMPDMLGVMIDLMGAIQTSQPVSLEDLEKVCSLGEHGITTPYQSKALGRPLFVHEVLANFICDTVTKPVVTLLDIESVEKERVSTSLYEDYPELTYGQLVEEIHREPTCKNVAHLLFYILRARPLKTFHKLNIHAALAPKDYMDFFRPAINQATYLKEKWMSSVQLPKVTVFLDEINTSSCLGLLKEVIVDGTFFGEPLPENLFIIAACNPHRGNSIIVNEQKQSGEMWLRSTYNVHRLPPTIQTLMWDYGALDHKQEEQYVKVKMRMMSSMFKDTEWFADELSNAIIHSQILIRGYAATHLRETFGYPRHQAEELAHSCVSQRDIQRVFTLFEWLTKGYKKFKETRFAKEDLGPNPDKVLQEHAIMGALGIVYYLRLNDKFRQAYQKDLKNRLRMTFTTDIERALQEELDFYAKHLSIPRGIAKTKALMENLFSIIACCCTRTPLIIVGAPGSSKTLSFNLALSNLKGAESKMELFRNSDIFPSLDPHFYQCSRRTTSTEVETVFQRAIKRQAGFNELGIRMNCVVFMDEAGLPEESHESLKVLHKYLDSKEVAFVAISNHPLDAAKTNRAVSLYRATYTKKDIKTLAKECLGAKERSNATMIVEKLCEPYDTWMNSKAEFSKFFGLRDFIHLIHYLRRTELPEITPQLVMEALERNFNGYHKSEDICRSFLKQMQSAPEKVQRRSIVDILRNSLGDQPKRSLQKDQETYDEVRYKLIIDPSEDGSVSRLLTMYKVLDPEQTRIFICSEFPEDSHLQKVNTIAAIRHAAEEGKTVLMSQTDDIHESFYDLFNQHFRRIDNPDPTKEPKFYANIAIGSHHKPCRVHKDFQCVVIIKESEVKDTPAPFLNRFEKYRVSHKDFLRARLDSFPPCMRIAVNAALEKVKDFFDHVGEDSFYGARRDDTVGSIALSILPKSVFRFKHSKVARQRSSHNFRGRLGVPPDSPKPQTARTSSTVLLSFLIDELTKSAGFVIPEYSEAELKSDAAYIVRLLGKARSSLQGVARAIQENKYSDSDLRDFVKETLQHLHNPSGPDLFKTPYGYAQIRGISSESCFVVMVFVQWLVQYMCKHLLQLMTAEALTQYNKKTLHSLWCWKTYLEHQNHFSLKSLIEKNLKIIRTHPKAGTVSTKLVCFTRFTPDINHLPSVHLSKVPPSTSSTDKKTMTDAMKNMICEEIHVVHLYKLTIISSEHMFRNYLKSFMESTAKVFVMVINMQETKKQMVNHIRIMVEQAEGSPRNPCKLFVLLLHFPPSMFYDCCYPALFLNGWDHHYFDSLTTHLSSDTPKFTDIRHWFTMCRSISAEDSSEGIAACEAFIRNNLSINPVDISVVASRITIGSKNGGEFNSTPRNGNEILTRFQKLLESPVGDVLCDMYAKYWKPSEMARYLEEAASYARNRKSTLSMTDSIGDFFQTTFQNFLTYMINMMNEGLNLDNVYKVVAGGEGGSDMERIKKDLFLQMMLCLPTPDLNQLKDYSYNWSVQSTTVTRTFFPFFVSISSIVDRLLDESKKRIQEKKHRESLTTVLELKVHDIDPMSMSEELLELLKNPKLLPTSDNSLLCCAVQAIKEHPELWDVYWRDFHVTRFHINIQEDAQLAGYPQEKPACTDSAIACLAKLHCSAAAAGLSGCKHLLLDLNPLTVLKQNILKSALPPKLPNPVSCLNEATQSGSPSELARFIIDFLFRSLAFGCLKWGSTLDTDDLFLFWSWRNAYRDVTSQSRVTEILFKSPEVTELNRVEMTVMAAVYLLLQTRKTLDEEISKLAFDFGSRMVFKFFSPKEPLQLRVPVLHVEDVMDRYQAAYQYDRPHRYTEEDDVTFRENLLTYFFAVEVDKRDEKDIVWFLNHVNALPSSHNDSHKSGSVSDGSTNPFHGLSQEVIGHMLGMILTPHTSSEDLAVPLEIFHHQTRKLVGAELMRTAVPGEVGPYVPPVYRNMLRISATADPRMTQLLADLYFNSTLEQLERVTPKETSFVAVIGDLQNVLKHIQNSFLIPELQILLRIELQAMMQMLLKKVAQGLADKQQQQNVIDSAIGIEDYIEGTIMDCNSDGREAAGHKLVLMKHLYKDLQGPGNLIVFLTQFDQSDGGLHFFESYKSQLNLHYLEVAIQFPFATGPKGRPRGYVEIELDKVYFELYMCIMEANKKGDFESSSHLLEWLKHCVQTQPTLTCGPGNPEINTKCFLRMSIWLIVYELYNIIKSPNLIETLCERIDFLDFTEQHQMVLRTFLKRSEMERSKRSETPLQEDMERILGRERRQEFSETDPLFDLFMKPSSEENDSTEESFRNALANLLAVVFSLPSESTHLWYLFHDPTKLRDTFLPGFMYPHKVNKDKMLYDCGILLNEDGEFGRPDYRDHDSGLSLHSFYLVTWSTIGTLCMSLLTNPQAQEAIHGHLISDWQPLRHFCLQQLRQIWLSMQTNLELNNEERDFFFVEAMLALFKKGQSVNKPPGVFHSQEDVFQYERMWHKDIYQSTMCGYRDQMLKRLTFLRDYIYCQFNELDSQYPQFPSEKQLKHNLVSVQDCSEEPKHTVLLKFLEDCHRLAVGSDLLPDLVEFYLWLDVHLAHLIRYEVAQTLSVGQLLERVEARPRSTGKKLQTLYGRLMTNFNKYIHLSGGSVEVDGCTVQTISQDTELVHFLSVDKGRNCGYLFAVIRSIVKIHNDVMSVPPAPDPKNAPHYHRWMPSEVERVDVREFSFQLDGVFSGNNKWLLSLIQSRYIPVESLTRPEVSLTSIQHTRSQPMFDLSKLESDIVRYFIAGKRTIEVGTLWKPFRFKSSKVGHTSVPASLTGPGVPVDLAALSQELPSCCKVELYCDERKQWETHFHNVSYGTLSDLVTCLKSSCGYMYKSFQRVGEEILEKDLMEYLRSYFDDEESSHASKEIFSKLGLDVKCLKPEQLETLEKVKMRNLFRTLEMFVGWIGDCLFDFHMLPFSVKTPLPSEVAQTIQREIANHDVTLPVIEELEEKVSSLSQQSVLESQFKPTDSLRQCLIDLKLYGEKDGPFYLVPLGVQIQHYMYFVVFLRRLKLDVKGKQVANDQMKPSVKNNWSDFVHDIWTRLPHFLDKWRAYSIYSDTAEADAILHPEQILSDVDTTSDTGSLVDREGDSLSADILEQHQSIPEERKEEVPPEVGGPKEAPQGEVAAVTVAPAKGEVGGDNVTSKVKDSQHVPSQNGKDTESSPVSSPPQPPKQGISDVFGKPPSEKALNMTVEEVVQWLDTIKLGQLAEAFRSEEVDGALLATYDLKDLEDIGIELNKDRKKILVKFRQI